jgi:hypothetical protein
VRARALSLSNTHLAAALEINHALWLLVALIVDIHCYFLFLQEQIKGIIIMGRNSRFLVFDKFLIVTYQNFQKVSALVYLPNKATVESTFQGTFQRERKVTLMSCPVSTV